MMIFIALVAMTSGKTIYSNFNEGAASYMKDQQRRRIKDSLKVVEEHLKFQRRGAFQGLLQKSENKSR